MKKKDLADVRQKPVDEIVKIVEKKKKDLARAKLEIALGKTKNVHAVKFAKSELAQLVTLLREKQLFDVKSRGRKVPVGTTSLVRGDHVALRKEEQK